MYAHSTLSLRSLMTNELIKMFGIIILFKYKLVPAPNVWREGGQTVHLGMTGKVPWWQCLGSCCLSKVCARVCLHFLNIESINWRGKLWCWCKCKVVILYNDIIEITYSNNNMYVYRHSHVCVCVCVCVCVVMHCLEVTAVSDFYKV